MSFSRHSISTLHPIPRRTAPDTEIPPRSTRMTTPKATITASRDQLQSQLAAIFALAKSSNYTIEELLTDEMKTEMESVSALAAAREYIVEADAREEEAQAAQAKLAASLAAAQEELADQPADYVNLKIEVTQLKRQVEYYMKLSESAQERAGRYQARLREAVDRQRSDDWAAEKIKGLEAEVEKQRMQVEKLMEENRGAALCYEDLRWSHKQELALKENEVMQLVVKMERMEADRREQDEITEACGSLIETMGLDGDLTAAQLNAQTIAVQRSDQLVSAAVSEMLPLNRFYEHAFVILQLYLAVVADPHRSPTSVPTEVLDRLFEEVTLDLGQYYLVHDLLKDEGVAPDTIRCQVDDLGKQAGRLYERLSVIRRDFAGFVRQVSNQPTFWQRLALPFSW